MMFGMMGFAQYVVLAAWNALPLSPLQAGPWNDWEKAPLAEPAPKPERLGPGPHTLVISDGDAVTRMDYKSGAACQRARDEVRRQVAPPVTSGRWVIHGPPKTTAFCVPR